MQATTNICVKESFRETKRKVSRGSRAQNDFFKVPNEVLELIKEEDYKSNYSGAFIAIVVISAILGFIALVTYFTTEETVPSAYSEPFYFSDIFYAQSILNSFAFEWKNNVLVFQNDSRNVYSLKVHENRTVGVSVLLPSYHKSMKVSMDLTVWIVPNVTQKNKQLEAEHTYSLLYFDELTMEFRRTALGGLNDIFMTSVDWGPVEKSLVYVYNGNIYYSPNPLKVSFICLSCQLDQKRLYGVFLGYYKDQIFKSNKAYWWNEDAQHLAFLSMAVEDDKILQMEYFNHPNLYSTFINISYSKAGSIPSMYSCKLYVSELKTNSVRQIFVTDSIFREYYIIHVRWYNSSALLVSLYSRGQNQAAVLMCLLKDVKCFMILEREVSVGWINLEEYQNYIVVEKQSMLIMGLTPSDARNSRRQLAMVYVNKENIKWITANNYYTLNIVSFIDDQNCIVYIAKLPNSKDNHIFRTDLITGQTSCISCRLACADNMIHPSTEKYVFLHECKGPRPKKFSLIHMDSEFKGIAQFTEIDNSETIRKLISNKSLPTIEYFTINATDNKRPYPIFVKLSFPKIVNREHITKYPAIIILSNSPDEESVTKQFRLGWIDYLASFLRYVVIQIDTRGIGNQFFSYQTSIQKNIGVKDFSDLAKSTKAILSRYNFIDNTSVGIVGNEYGGYLSIKALSEFHDFPNVRCGVSIIPLVDFANYDSFFSERYLEKYKENDVLYKNSLLRGKPSLSAKEFLLIHNLDEEKVLFDSTAKFMKDLVANDILFQLLPFYKHEVKGSSWLANKFVLKKITSFFVNCFNKTSLAYSLLKNDSFHSFN